MNSFEYSTFLKKVGVHFLIMKGFLGCLLGALTSTVYSYSTNESSSAQCFASSPQNSCFSTTEYRSFPLISVSDETSDTRVLRFALPEADMPINIVPASCFTVRYVDKKNGGEVVRPFTPINRNDQRGYFEILVNKRENSKLGEYLYSLEHGAKVEMKGPWVQVPIRANQYRNIGMIGYGTGIAPLYQVALNVLTTPRNSTDVSLIYANMEEGDVLLGNELNDLRKNHELFSPYFMISKPSSNWMGGIGPINKDVIKALMPSPQRAIDSVILVSGPSSFMSTVCGDKDRKAVSSSSGDLRGYLKELGYLPRMVYKL